MADDERREDPAAVVTSGWAVSRRGLLRGMVVAPALAALTGCSEDEPASPFQHGLASGDPLPDGVVLWTRITTKETVDVAWVVAEDPGMQAVVQRGVFRTDAERDFTVKVDVRGLAPGRTYHYRFEALGTASIVGRTRTAPAGAVSRLRFAMVSCSSYAHGYFHVYRSISEQPDFDAVLHLGDYIYEYASDAYGDVRAYEPAHEILTLADYRARHALYKRDPDLRAAHRQHPFVTIWDDHETANDAWKDGAENHQPDEGSFADRKAAARRAYFEWMPIREGQDGRIFRRLAFGDLVDLVLLDTRLWARTKQAGGFIGPDPAPDPNRTLLGDEQAAWMEEQLRSSKARWKLLGQQVMVGNIVIDAKQVVNLDQWHGYPESRARLLEFFRTSGVANIVVLTGDIHSSWANEIITTPRDPAAYDPATGKGSLAVEFVTPGVTSPGLPEILLGVVAVARPLNPHVRWLDPTNRGYVVLDVTAERVQAAWFHVDDVTRVDGHVAFAKAFRVRDGSTRLEEEAAPAAPRPEAPPLAT
jgi:alkaline phosphatase D